MKNTDKIVEKFRKKVGDLYDNHKAVETELILAIQAREDEIIKIIKECTPSHITREYRDTDILRDKIIKNINNQQS